MNGWSKNEIKGDMSEKEYEYQFIEYYKKMYEDFDKVKDT